MDEYLKTLNDAISIINERLNSIEVDKKNVIKPNLVELKLDVRSINFIKKMSLIVNSINARLSAYDKDITTLKDE